MKGFKAQHRPCHPFDKTMILFDHVVQILTLHDPDQSPFTGEFVDHIDRLKARQIGPTFIGSVANFSVRC